MPEKLRQLAQDRLIWFIILGSVLFAADALLQSRDRSVIEINLPLVEKLVAQWEGQTKRQPNARELDALIEGYIREEILVREAARLGLDEDDVIIRRRLAQKVEFMLADEMPDALPDEAELRQFFEDNRAYYDAPPAASWRHVFVETQAEASRLMALLNKNDGDWKTQGRPFMLNRQYARQSEIELSRLMGTQFAEALFAETLSGAAEKGWRGPLQSAYGWHIVYIDERHAPMTAEFDMLIEQVASDWQKAKRQEVIAAAWQDLRARYQVELLPVEEPMSAQQAAQ